jgi:hypothetical protein
MDFFREKTQVPSPLISSSGIGLAPKWAAAAQGPLCELNPFPGSVLAQSGSGSQNRLFQPLKFEKQKIAAEGCGRVRLAQALHGGRV